MAIRLHSVVISGLLPRAVPSAATASLRLSATTARTAVILNHLEKGGFIARIPDRNDNRQIIVCLSEKGVEMLEKHHREIVKYMVKILERLGEKDAMEYVRLQKKLMSAISEG